MGDSPLKIAILGSRGIPANYGGFETLAEELSVRLSERGHEVTVYCCRPYSLGVQSPYRGVERVVLPTIRTKQLEKPLYALFSLLHAARRSFDLVLMLGVSVSAFCFIPRLFGTRVAINIDGLEWQRRKWGRFASLYLALSERLAGVTCNQVITDARCIQSYYEEKYSRETVYIPYGCSAERVGPGPTLRRFGLGEREYILFVGRFEEENNPLLVREAFDEIEKTEKKLVLVGTAPFSREYIERLKATRNRNVVFTGPLFGESYRELLSNAYLYLQAGEVGGTHPALVEAMGAGCCVLANDVPEHREVLKDAGLYYSGKQDLKSKMTMLIEDPVAVELKRRAAAALAKERYSWDAIADEYEGLFYGMLGHAAMKDSRALNEKIKT